MNLWNASGFKYGALFILGDLFETHFSLLEAFLPSPSLEPTCFREALLAVGAHSHFFPHTSNGPSGGGPVDYR